MTTVLVVNPASRSACDHKTVDSTRVDRYLWAIRLFKTRADATKACTGGHVRLGDRAVKPAQKVSVGDRITARVGDRERIVEITKVIEKRVGAAIAAECFLDFSAPVPERTTEAQFGIRDRGAGRPTKRDRRKLDETFGRRES